VCDTAMISVRHWTELAAVDDVLARCLADLGGIEQFVKPGETVVIKPNITANAPSDSGGTTRLEVVEALLRQVLRCQPGRVVLAEGTGAFGTTLDTAFPTGGWRELAARYDVELYNLDGGPHDEVMIEKPHYPYPLPFSRLVRDCDVFITVPCLKTHISCDYTVSLKNSYALIPQWKRSEVHGQYMLEEALTDINRIRKPDLTVVDAWDGAEGIAGGNKFDRPAGARLMIVGADPVALDVISKEIMGMENMRTCYLQWAIEDGVGVGERDRITTVGDPLEECIHRFETPAEEVLKLAPSLTVHDCGACSRCRSASLVTMMRFGRQKLLKPITFILGGDGDAPQVGDDGVIVVGDCASKFAYLGKHVPGCPARAGDVIQAIEQSGAVCLQCRDLARKAIPGLAPEFLAYLRVTGAGAEVFAGDQVKRDQWHLELLVGDCMERYSRAVLERATQFGLDPERDIIYLQGCPPDANAIREALRRLEQAFAAVQP